MNLPYNLLKELLINAYGEGKLFFIKNNEKR